MKTDVLSKKRQEYKAHVDKEVLAAVEFELVGSVAHAGGVLSGISVRFGESDCLMTLRASFGSKSMVSFVGCPDLGSCFRKAVNEAYSDDLQWREDRWAKNDS